MIEAACNAETCDTCEATMPDEGTTSPRTSPRSMSSHDGPVMDAIEPAYPATMTEAPCNPETCDTCEATMSDEGTTSPRSLPSRMSSHDDPMMDAFELRIL